MKIISLLRNMGLMNESYVEDNFPSNGTFNGGVERIYQNHRPQQWAAISPALMAMYKDLFGNKYDLTGAYSSLPHPAQYYNAAQATGYGKKIYFLNYE